MAEQVLKETANVAVSTDDRAIPPVAAAPEESGENIMIARDYLGQLQQRSLQGLAEWQLGTTQGVWRPEPEQLEEVIEGLRAQRRDPDGELGQVVTGHSQSIEKICEILDLPLRDGVASGVVYQPRDVPAQTPVFGTNASVIVIPEHSLMLCHFVCKALARAFPIEEEPKRYAISLKPKRILKRFRRNPELIAYLAGSVAYAATRDPRSFRGLQFEPLAGAARVVAEQLLCATEIFMIAHEYGHHIDEHRLGDSADVEGLTGDTPIIQELRADYLAALISAHFGARCEPHNTWAASGVGAIVALGAMNLVLRARYFLETGGDRVPASNTHPPMMVRLVAVDRLNRLYDPRERIAMRNQRRNMREVVTSLWDLIRPELRRLHDRGLRPLPLSQDEAQWLPP